MEARTAYHAAAAFVITGAGLGAWFTVNPLPDIAVDLVMNSLLGAFLGAWAAFIAGLCYWSYTGFGGDPA